MRIRIGVTCFLLGTLTFFFGWSIDRSLVNRSTAAFGMTGTVQTVTVTTSTQAVDAASAQEAARAARRFLVAHNISVIIASVGDGEPSMIVVDPARRVPWLSPIRDSRGSVRGIYLFNGSYSAARWRAVSSVPLLPSVTAVSGFVDPPRDPERPGFTLQYVRPLPTLFPTGNYVFGGASQSDMSRFQAILSRQGLSAGPIFSTPLIIDIASTPFVVITALLLSSGSVATAGYWSLLLSKRTAESAIHRVYGATTKRLIIRLVLYGAPSVLMGLTGGTVAASIFVRLLSGAPLATSHLMVLLASLTGGVVVVLAVWTGATVSHALKAGGDR